MLNFPQSDKAEALMGKRWETARRNAYRDRSTPVARG